MSQQKVVVTLHVAAIMSVIPVESDYNKKVVVTLHVAAIMSVNPFESHQRLTNRAYNSNNSACGGATWHS